MNVSRFTAWVLIAMLILIAAGPTVEAAMPGPTAPQAALGTAFTYQGRLTDGGAPADGSYDFLFTLYDAESGGSAIGPQLDVEDVAVSDGRFTVLLDFGAGVFAGEARWLEIGVRPGDSSDAFTTLSPRQPLMPSPHALYASTAPWSGLSGVPAGLADGDDDTLGELSCTSGQIAKWDGSAWSCAADNTSSGSGADDAWLLGGNAGTNPELNYVGTSDFVTLTLAVDEEAALRLIPSTETVNLIGGYVGNRISIPSNGSVIGGGGSADHVNAIDGDYDFIGSGEDQTINGDSSAIVGGGENFVESNHAFIGGGVRNESHSSYAFIGSGYQNNVQATSSSSAIVGGANNVIGGSYAFIGGGSNNELQNSSWSVVDGGEENNIEASYSAIGGGRTNYIGGWYATISGGYQNSITDDYDNLYATIGGGYKNSIAGAHASFIGGGEENTVSAPYSTIAGGNIISITAEHSFVGGGSQITITKSYGVIGGGQNNYIGCDYCVIGGGGGEPDGSLNFIGSGNTLISDWGVIGGGRGNLAGTDDNVEFYITISGGHNNLAFGSGATVGGGQENEVHNSNSTIGGGWKNRVNPPSSFIGGGYNNLIADGSSAATIGGGTNNALCSAGGAIVGGAYNTIDCGEYDPDDSQHSFIGGGEGNVISHSMESTLVGGTLNTIVDANYAFIGGGHVNDISSNYGFIGGGYDNHVSGSLGAVVGGENNSATGYAAIVAGGRDNTASGYGSFAAGENAHANSDNCFAWSDGASTTCPDSNTWIARASSGVYFYTGLSTGSYLAAGGSSWNSLSDRNQKENFEAVDGQLLLERLAALEITTWNYKGQDPAIRHIGPMAQDFNALLPDLGGEGETYINSMDADGVALIAIQALYAQNQELAAENAELKAQVDDLETRLAALEAAVEAMAAQNDGGE